LAEKATWYGDRYYGHYHRPYYGYRWYRHRHYGHGHYGWYPRHGASCNEERGRPGPLGRPLLAYLANRWPRAKGMRADDAA
jgi:hypothetical protein